MSLRAENDAGVGSESTPYPRTWVGLPEDIGFGFRHRRNLVGRFDEGQLLVSFAYGLGSQRLVTQHLGLHGVARREKGLGVVGDFYTLKQIGPLPFDVGQYLHVMRTADEYLLIVILPLIQELLEPWQAIAHGDFDTFRHNGPGFFPGVARRCAGEECNEISRFSHEPQNAVGSGKT